MAKRKIPQRCHNSCGLFISVYDSKLSFINQTAREFLTAPKREGEKGSWKGTFGLPQSNGTISRICLDYLLLPDLGRPAKSHSVQDAQISEHEQYPFLSYSADNWFSHYGDQETALADQSVEDVCILCDETRHHVWIWIPVYDPLFLQDLLESKSEWTNLALASYFGLNEVTKLLLDKGADVNIEGGPYHTALQAASARYQLGFDRI